MVPTQPSARASFGVLFPRFEATVEEVDGLTMCSNCGYANLADLRHLRAATPMLNAGIWSVLGPGKNSSVAVSHQILDSLGCSLASFLEVELACPDGSDPRSVFYLAGPVDVQFAVPSGVPELGGWHCTVCGNYTASVFEPVTSQFTHFASDQVVLESASCVSLGDPRGANFLGVLESEFRQADQVLRTNADLHPLTLLSDLRLGRPDQLLPAFAPPQLVDWYD